MDETITEETNVNPEVEETPVEEKPQEEAETPKKETEESPEQYSEREKRYYARMKQAENIAKQAREELAKVKKAMPTSDIDSILEVQEATRGLDTAEIEELKIRADVLKVPLTEARKNENYQLWQRAYREKVEKEKTALPSTTVGNVQKPKTLKEMTLQERTELFRKIGLITPKPFPPKPPIVE